MLLRVRRHVGLFCSVGEFSDTVSERFGELIPAVTGRIDCDQLSRDVQRGLVRGTSTSPIPRRHRHIPQPLLADGQIASARRPISAPTGSSRTDLPPAGTAAAASGSGASAGSTSGPSPPVASSVATGARHTRHHQIGSLYGLRGLTAHKPATKDR
jgi:hypothetical protein